MAGPAVPNQYRFPNTYNSGAPHPEFTFLNSSFSSTASNTQNKNGGIVLYGNPLSTQTRFHNDQQATLVGNHPGHFGGGYPVIVSGTLVGQYASGMMAIYPIDPNKSFAKVTPNEYQVFQLKPTMKIAGSVSTILQTPGARFALLDDGRNQNPGYVYTARVVTAGWNYVTGRFLNTFASGTKDTLNTDNSASPTRQLPGILVYLDAGKTIASGYLYKAKTD